MYQLSIDSRVSKSFRSIPKAIASKIIEAFDSLIVNPRRHGVEKLSGLNGYRFRVADYRILFMIDDTHKVIRVYKIAHRSQAYR